MWEYMRLRSRKLKSLEGLSNFHLHRIHIYLCKLEVKNKNWVHLRSNSIGIGGLLKKWDVGSWKLRGRKIRVFRGIRKKASGWCR